LVAKIQHRRKHHVWKEEVETDAVASKIHYLLFGKRAKNGNSKNGDTHQQQVIIEKQELSDKIEKLEAFAKTYIYKSLPFAERERLTRQHCIMLSYEHVLKERIENER
jgi:hypothetical protein